jgi:hypothetical protein
VARGIAGAEGNNLSRSGARQIGCDREHERHGEQQGEI